MTSGLKKHSNALKVVVGVAVCVALLMASYFRIQYVNTQLLSEQKQAVLDANGIEEIADSKEVIEQYGMGEPIDVAGCRDHDHLMQEGVTFSFSDPRFVTVDEMLSLTGGKWDMASLAGRSHDEYVYLLVDLTISNESDIPTSPLWFDVEAGSFSACHDESATEALNGYWVDENYHAENEFYWRAPTHSTHHMVVAFELWQVGMSSSQWALVRDLNYKLVFRDYPRKIEVSLHS